LRLKLGKANALENNKTQTGSPKETLRLKLGRASALENMFISVSVTGGGHQGVAQNLIASPKGQQPTALLEPPTSGRLRVSCSEPERERERERERRFQVKLSSSSDIQKRNFGRP
jgi:hypothetical protein